MLRVLLVTFVLTINVFALDTSLIEEEKKETFVKVSDISSAATQTITDLQDSLKLIQAQEEVLKVHEGLHPFIKSTNILLNDTKNRYLEYLGVKELTLKEQEYRIRISKLKKWNLLLESRTQDFDENRIYLENLLALWSKTLENAKEKKAPKLVIENISSVIKSIKELQKKAKKRYDEILIDSNLINKKILELNTILEETLKAKEVVSKNVFHQNSRGLFTLWNEERFNSSLYVNSAFLEVKKEFYGLVSFYKTNEKRGLLFSLYAILLFCFVFFFYYLYRKKRLFVNEKSYEQREYFFITLPISTFIVLASLLNYFMFSDIPSSVREFQLLIIIVPLFLIIKKSLPEGFYKYLYFFFTLYTLFMLDKYANASELDARVLGVLVSISLSAYVFFLIKNRVFRLFFNKTLLKLANGIFGIIILLLSVSIISDFYGATLLAEKITSGILLLLYAALIFYVLSMILRAYVIILLRRRIASVPLEVERFTSGVEKSITLFIKVFMILWFIKTLFTALGFWTYMLEMKDSVIALSWRIGETTISLESIFDFMIIIFGTWFLVKVVNIILEVEVFSHFRFTRGIQTAIVTTLNYLLTITGVLIALSSLGITIEQFALIFGALGVGIGFGIRNIIANFISGIIMVFERPIQIGDTITINNTMGTVQSIKTRSSIIKTFDGSEVIIPNADFVAKEITNWTLSDERRRKTLTFKVDIESDIDTVLDIMRSVVQLHPNVLSDPEPMATFLGFSEYYLEFKLYFWLNENFIVAESEIAVNIYKTLKENGVKMPVPKHDIQQAKKKV